MAEIQRSEMIGKGSLLAAERAAGFRLRKGIIRG
jgi:hypothetical protein